MKPIPIAINLLARQLTTSHSLPLRIGITGGIGSGKSYICHLLEQAGHRVFYCDEVAKHIIRVHPTVRRELTALVGEELYDTEGELLKPVLRAYLCQGVEYAARVNAIVHPRVAEAYVDFCQSMVSVPTVEMSSLKASFPSISANREITLHQLQQIPVGQVAFMECALLFESGFRALVEKAVLVHVSTATQLSRIMQRDHISVTKARQWVALQMLEEDKMKLADAVLLNE